MSENIFKLYTCMPTDWSMEEKRQAVKDVIMGISASLRDAPLAADLERDPRGVEMCITITLEEQEQPAHEHLKDAE